MLQKTFNGKVIVSTPFTQKETSFQLSHTGIYAIWQEGRLFGKTPVDKFKIYILREPEGPEINLSPSIFRPSLSGWKKARMELKRFSATNGSYKLLITEGSSLSAFEKLYSRLFPAQLIDYDQYFIQVRESQPLHRMLLAIPLFLIAAFLL